MNEELLIRVLEEAKNFRQRRKEQDLSLCIGDLQRIHELLQDTVRDMIHYELTKEDGVEMKEALIRARGVLLLRGEMGGWALDDIIEAVHKIDEALGNPLTPLHRVACI